jgi:hypothetical protein
VQEVSRVRSLETNPVKTSTRLAKLDEFMDERWPEYCRQRQEKVWPRPSLRLMMLLGRARILAIMEAARREQWRKHVF